MKYLVMICQGHLPLVGVGYEALHVNKDVKPFILYFLPKGQKPSRRNLLLAVRHFHLAFKGMDTEEIYDVLMAQLIAAANKYDPAYAEKVKRVVGVIQGELSKRKQFCSADINRHLEFDCHKHLRLLGRRGFLQAVEGPKTTSIPPPRFMVLILPDSDRNLLMRRALWKRTSAVLHRHPERLEVGSRRLRQGIQLAQQILRSVKLDLQATRLQPDPLGQIGQVSAQGWYGDGHAGLISLL
jgi:hypothetical protein